MPDEKMRELCTQISSEKDSERLMELVEELTKHLENEQNAIKAKIAANLKTGRGNAA